MTWVDDHRKSGVLAAEAEGLTRIGERDAAAKMYAEAARCEALAFRDVEPDKTRSYGILAVSAASLWFKSRAFDEAKAFVLSALLAPGMPQFAELELRSILYDVWTEEAKSKAKVGFFQGQLNVSIRGDDVVVGGAPLDLIVEKVQAIQALFYRTIEWLRGDQPRVRGQPSAEIVSSCRPWLFQAPAGSYQFSIAIQEPAQKDFFRERIPPERIVREFIEIVGASVSSGEDLLSQKVDNAQYRNAFLKLSRNLAPSGKSISSIEMREAGSSVALTIAPESRRTVSERLKVPSAVSAATETFRLSGILRAVHLDKDWLELSDEGRHYRVSGLQDTMDDVIGPMVNRRVLVVAVGSRQKPRLVDIELDG